MHPARIHATSLVLAAPGGCPVETQAGCPVGMSSSLVSEWDGNSSHVLMSHELQLLLSDLVTPYLDQVCLPPLAICSCAAGLHR